MRNRKSLFAFLVIGAIILGLAPVFNYGSAIGPETIQFKDGKIGESYDAEYEPKISGALPAFGWSAEAPVLTYISSYGLNGALQFLTGTPSKSLPIRGTPKKAGTMQALVTFHYMGKSGWLPGVPVPKTKDYIVKINILDEKGVLPTPTPDEASLGIDFSGLKAGTAGRPYSGAIKAKNAKNPKWILGSNNLSEFGLTAPASSYGSSFVIRSINSTSAREGIAAGTVTLVSRMGKTKDGEVATEEISGDFKIEIKKNGGGGSLISPKINSFKVNNVRSARVTDGDEITFSWDVRDDVAAGFETSVEILGRLTPQSASDPAGQQNICVKAGQEKCGLSGSVKVNIHRSSAFTLKAKNTLNGKSKISTSAVYVIVKPEENKFGTLVAEGTLDGKQYAGRVIPIINNEEKSGEDVWKLLKDGKEDGQEKVNINSLPTVFNRSVGNYKLELDSSVSGFKLISATGKKISAAIKDISPNGGELKSSGTVRFGINFKASDTVVPKYSCNSRNACVRDDANGTYSDSNCNNECQPTTGDLTITTASLPDAIKNTAYSQQFSATGGTAPYKWSKISGSLPSGLKLSSDGLLSGQPTKAESKTFKIKVADSSSPSKSKEQEFNLTVKLSGSTGGNFDINIGPTYRNRKNYICTTINAPTGNLAADEKISYRIFFKCHDEKFGGLQCNDDYYNRAVQPKPSEGSCIVGPEEAGGCNKINFSEVPFSSSNYTACTAYDFSGRTQDYYFLLEATRENTGQVVKKFLHINKSGSSGTNTPTPTPSSTPSGNVDPTTTEGRNKILGILQSAGGSIQACPPSDFMKNAVNALHAADSRWGFDYHKAGSKWKISSDRIAWWTGSGSPVSGGGSAYYYDIIKNYCENGAKLSMPKSPTISNSSEEKWYFPLPANSDWTTGFLDNPLAEFSESPADAQVAADDEESELIPASELALVGGVATPNKSLIAKTLYAMDSISLPVQFYTEKLMRDSLNALFWPFKKKKKIIEPMRKRPGRDKGTISTSTPPPPAK